MPKSGSVIRLDQTLSHIQLGAKNVCFSIVYINSTFSPFHLMALNDQRGQNEVRAILMNSFGGIGGDFLLGRYKCVHVMHKHHHLGSRLHSVDAVRHPAQEFTVRRRLGKGGMDRFEASRQHTVLKALAARRG
jgi:hypothetical protein